MTTEQRKLFKKYSVTKNAHDFEHSSDNWNGVEIYRIMHDGNLPPQDDFSIAWVCDFLDKINDAEWCRANLVGKNRGSLEGTAKRSIYLFADKIIEERKLS